MLKKISYIDSILVFIVFVSLIVGLGYLTGLWGSEFGAYGDESLHYVTGLMIRDFVVSPSQWLHPLPFAIDYYLHFPKIGLGNWPPVFPVLEAAWMLAVGHSRVSMLVFLAVLASVLGAITYQSIPGSRTFRFLACLLLLLSAPSQFQTSTVMAEVALVVFTWTAFLCFLRLLENPSMPRACLWALFTMIAILTKGNAWILAPIALLVLLASGKWKLLLGWPLWMGIALIGAICIPYTLLTMRVVTQGWDTRSFPGLGYYALSLVKHVELAANLLGWPLTLVALLGCWFTCIGPILSLRRPSLFWTATAIYAAIVILFHTAVPTSIEQRKIYQILPACAAFLVAALEWIANRWKSAPHWLLAVLAAIVFLSSGFQISKPYQPGINEAVEFVQHRPDSTSTAILVSSNPFMNDLEGGLIAAWAERDRFGGTYLVRATKLLLAPPVAIAANLTELPLLHSTPQALLEALDAVPISYAIVHTAPASRNYLHHALLLAALQSKSSGWELVSSQSPKNGFPDSFHIYHRLRTAPSSNGPKVTIDLRHRLGIQLGGDK